MAGKRKISRILLLMPPDIISKSLPKRVQFPLGLGYLASVLKIRRWRQFLRDDLARDAFVMFLGTSFLNFFNLVYSLFLLRNLSPADFGLFNSLLALLTLFSQFPTSASFVFIRYVSVYYAQGNFQKIRKIIFSLGARLLGVGAVVFLMMMVMNTFFSSFLKVPDKKLFLVLNLTILSAYLAAVPAGTLQGLQKFSYLSPLTVAGGLVKLALVVFLVKIGLGVMGALSAFLFSSLFGILFYFYFLNRTLARQKNYQRVFEKINLGEIYRYFLPVFFMTLINAIFNNMDIVLVKHFFSSLEAGYYSISQVVGKVVLFFPACIVTVMFPKVAHLEARNQDTRFILKKSLIYTLCLSGLVASGAILFPGLILRILTHRVYPDCLVLVRLFALNMVLLSLISVFLNYYLSLNATGPLYCFFITIFLEIALISIFHQSLIQVLSIIFLCFLSLLLLNLFVTFKGLAHQPKTL